MIAMGSFDGLNALLATIPIPYLNLVVMSIVDKINLPLIALASFYWLGRRYKLSHYLGIFLTLYGILVSFIPYFMGNNIKCHIGWLFVYISNIIPATASFVYKEKKLKIIREFDEIDYLFNYNSIFQSPERYIGEIETLIDHENLITNSPINPHLKFSNSRDHGYLVLSLSEDKVIARWSYVNTLIRRENSIKKEVKFEGHSNNYKLKKVL